MSTNTASFDNLSHKIRTPLAVIRANAQLLKHLEKKGQLSPELLTRALDCLDQESHRLTLLIDSMENVNSKSTAA